MSVKEYENEITIETKDWSGPLPLFVQLLRFYKINPDTFLLKDVIDETIQRIFPEFPQDLTKESEFLVGICMLIYLKSRWLSMGEKDPKESLDLKEDVNSIHPENYLSETEIASCVQFFLKQKEKQPFYLVPTELFRPRLPAIAKIIKLPAHLLLTNMKKIEEKFQKSTQFFTISRKKSWSLKQKIQFLKKILEEKRECFFSDILEEPEDSLEQVVGFCCILTLFYKKEISLLQKEPFSHISIKT